MADYKIRKQIYEDWNAEFPFLRPYRRNELCLMTDVAVIGISFNVSYGVSYIPSLNIWPIWNGLMMSDHWAFSIDLVNYKNVQFFIDFKQNEYYFDKAVACTKEQFGSVLKNIFSFSDIVSILSKYLIKYSPKSQVFEFMGLVYAYSQYYGVSYLYDAVLPFAESLERKFKKYAPYPQSAPFTWIDTFEDKIKSRRELIENVQYYIDSDKKNYKLLILLILYLINQMLSLS